MLMIVRERSFFFPAFTIVDFLHKKKEPRGLYAAGVAVWESAPQNLYVNVTLTRLVLTDSLVLEGASNP